MKKRIVSVLLVCLMAASLCSVLTGCNNDKRVTINVYNWGEYISNGEDDSLDVNEQFTKETGIKVNYTTYATNEELYAKLKAGGSDYDIIIPSDYMIGKLAKEGMLEELNFDNIPNYEYIDKKFTGMDYDKNEKYTVPYTWGTVGIFYNKTMVDTEDLENVTWDLLWNEKYSGQILMFDNPRDTFAIALKKLGYSMNTTNEKELEEAYNELAKQKPLVQAYVMDQIFNKMANGEAALAPYYAGDGRIMMEDNPDIGFVVPTEGTNLFIDAMCIPKGAKHKTEAEKYIDFMCRKDIAIANAEYIGYSTPHTQAIKELDPEIANNPNFYPPADVIAKTEVYMTLPDKTNKKMDDLWVKLKTE